MIIRTPVTEVWLMHKGKIDKFFNDYLSTVMPKHDMKLVQHCNKERCHFDLQVDIYVKSDDSMDYIEGMVKKIADKTTAYKYENTCITGGCMTYNFYIKDDDLLKIDLLRSFVGIKKYNL